MATLTRMNCRHTSGACMMTTSHQVPARHRRVFLVFSTFVYSYHACGQKNYRYRHSHRGRVTYLLDMP